MHNNIYEKTETITPKRAKKILSTTVQVASKLGVLKNFRSLALNHLKYLTDEIKNNRWEYDGSPIRIAPDGRLLDGQHRLNACIKANKPIRLRVMYNFPPDLIHTIDMGKKRTAGDYLKFKGIGDKNDAALVRALHALATNKANTNIVSNTDIENILQQFETEISWVRKSLPKKNENGVVTRGALTGAAFVLAYGLWPHACNSLLSRFLTGSSSGTKDNAKALSRVLLNSRADSPNDRLELSQKVLKCIYAEAHKTQLKNVRPDQGLINLINKLRKQKKLPVLT